MHNACVRFFLFSSMVVFCTASVSAQTTRQIEVKVMDEQDQPLADASVLARPSTTRVFSDEMGFGDLPPVVPRALVKTDASGVATLEVGQLLGDDVDAPVSVTVWKPGYGLQSTSVQKKVDLKCWPLRKRTVQIIDWQDKPVKGLRVEHASPMEAVLEETKIRWWKEDAVVTDEFGLATLETHAGGQVQLTITEPDGTVHRASVNDLNRFSGRTPDLRDLQVIRLTPHGKIEGKLPAEFVKAYSLRVERDYRSGMFRVTGSQTGLESQPEMDADGNFRFDSVAEGWHWLIVYRRQSLDPATGDVPPRQPVAIYRVQVQAGKTAKVQVETVTTAKVSGRVVCTDGQCDLSDLRLMISRASSSEAEIRNPQWHNIDRVRCNADGTFVCPLPVGRYQVNCITANKWHAAVPLNFEVGTGAVSIATDDLRVTPLKKAKVTWHHEHRWANSLLSVMDHRLVFRTKDRQIGDCSLTADGYGMAYLMPNEEVTVISTNNIIPSSQAVSAFVDKDPSENFDLELIKTPHGLATNIAMRGRVVDTDGKGMRNVPVTISLTYEGTAGTSVRSIQASSQLLDVVLTERDGSFQIPPRQLLSRMTVPGRATTDEAKFTFTISTPANPQPIEAQKIFELKPDAWDVVDIQFPDLVIDRPLGGSRLSGKVMNAEGQPSAGELLRLADKRRLVRTLSDRDGNFAIEDLAGPTWLMRESDWSVRDVNDYSQPIVADFMKIGATAVAGAHGWQRLEQAERIKLAKELMQAVPAPQGAMPFIPGRAAAIASDDFYLQPTKTFDQLLLMKGANADLLRSQFIDFWADLSDEKLRALADAMTQNSSRIQLLLTLADRRPSVAAYEKIMEAIEYPDSTERRNPLARQTFDMLGNVGVKLHLYGALEPHRAKIRQFLEQYAIEAARIPPNPGGNAANPPNARAMIPEELGVLPLCRALLDPEQFATNFLEEIQANSAELSNEDRVMQMKNTAIFLQLFPSQFSQLPPDRLGMSDGAMQYLGMQAPLQAIEAVKQGKLGPEYLRAVATSALMNDHADAAEVFRESNKLFLQSDANRTRISVGMFNVRIRQPDLVWYEAAKRTSPEFGRMAAWHLAYECLSGKYEDNSMTILPMRERYHLQMLNSAYCMINDYPDLAQQVAQRAIPRLLANAEQEFGQTFGRGVDFSLVAWFDPRAACDVVIKLKKRLDDEQKNQPAGQRDARLYSKQNELAALRMTCLRGLLLDGL